MSRRTRALAGMLALVALAVGLPLALAATAGRPWPTRLVPLRVMWRTIRAGDVSDATMIKILAAVVWIAWARLLLSVVLELGARLAGRQLPRIALLGSS